MKNVKITRITAILTILVMMCTAFALAGCGDSSGGDSGSSGSTSGNSSGGSAGDVPLDESDFLLPSTPGDNVLGNDLVDIDASNTEDGYISIKYKGDSDKVKFQMKADGNTYTYDLHKKAGYMVFPFSCGDGQYSLEIYENVVDDQYAQVCAETVDVAIKDPNTPFLYPNNYVDYAKDDKVVSLTYDVTKDTGTQLQAVQDVYNYVTGNIEYDYDLADSVEPGYIPTITDTIDSKKGICFDYSSLMSAMLRIRNIPTKLVVGYQGDVYHAWISVYISDVGWVENVIEFDGSDWTLMDPTYAASGGADAESYYVNNQDKYKALYFY
ncbi:MAG: transglutaminase domain-containing protein [Firmicutes bacterium]|nr:transglutaminase domain-containing protein [Bacillota bacterium]